ITDQPFESRSAGCGEMPVEALSRHRSNGSPLLSQSQVYPEHMSPVIGQSQGKREVLGEGLKRNRAAGRLRQAGKGRGKLAQKGKNDALAVEFFSQRFHLAPKKAMIPVSKGKIA